MLKKILLAMIMTMGMVANVAAYDVDDVAFIVTARQDKCWTEYYIDHVIGGDKLALVEVTKCGYMNAAGFSEWKIIDEKIVDNSDDLYWEES